MTTVLEIRSPLPRSATEARPYAVASMAHIPFRQLIVWVTPMDSGSPESIPDGVPLEEVRRG